MRLGVDFGTTRTIVAAVDRGNYPVVSFRDADGDAHEFFPSVAALTPQGLVYGFDALRAARDQAAPLARSFKRLLAFPDVSTRTVLRLGGQAFPVLDVLSGYLRALNEALRDTSSLNGVQEPSCTVVAVPAHAHGAQRYLTLEAFRRAGFEVTAMINEPSAAGYEYTHRQSRTLSSRRTRVLVYDLGGGTFDASLVKVDGRFHEVLDSLGINSLGGDDFDAVLLECALREAGLGVGDLNARELADLREECREAKERLSPQTRRMLVEVRGEPVIVSVADFYAAAGPLVEASIEAMSPLVGNLDDADALVDVAGIYLVGGASGLPLVPRLLRERFGRRVHRSPYPAASTAIGLAIAADTEAGYTLTDQLSRGFGVFREGWDGNTLEFDPIIGRDEAIPEQDQRVVVQRQYRAAHNLGRFRFVEYSGLDERGQPRGELVPFAEVLFPFDPELQGCADLNGVPVERRPGGPEVREEYLVDANGLIEVRLSDLSTGYIQTHALRPGGPTAPSDAAQQPTAAATPVTQAPSAPADQE
ncbi:Hsp70 family protein [Gephyromycinifex aptenodytis]|uniref:Hsp70 family protein n=1 Tax=Gephyromycinifex aptenodytis TaxID=2716227 RepID=UPI001446B21C|nr:Hsp70 family protein [Gephyromycinifex aptenodytis]